MGNLEILKYVLDELSLNDLDMLYTDLDIIGIIGIANAKMIAANTEVKEEKSEVKEYMLQEVVDKLYSVIETRRNSTDLLRIGDAIIRRHEIKCISNISLCSNADKVRATIDLDNGSRINVEISLEWLMNLKF